MVAVGVLFLGLTLLACAFPKVTHAFLIAVFVGCIAAAVIFFGVGLVMRS
jgi:hypothetical protein